MKIFSAAQIREWDQFTITQEGISSVDLMERAAEKCAAWIKQYYSPERKLIFFCGCGNNGGDGLAIARMLYTTQCPLEVYILKAAKRSADCDINLQRLHQLKVMVNEIENEANFPEITEDDVVIEALFGTGLNKSIEGIAQMLVQYINKSEARVVSIDIPAGLFADESSAGNTVIEATHTLSFQCNKLAFMLAENAGYTGKVHLLDIGLQQQYYNDTETDFYTIDEQLLQPIFKPRQQQTHKYNYGHALLYAGSTNMMGAAILSAKACLRSGAGLVTVYAAPELVHIIPTALPEAIASSENDFATITKKKAAIGIGPGLAVNNGNTHLLRQVITDWDGPIVIDASALGMLSSLLPLLGKRKNNDVVLTPHRGEFEKLFGKCSNDFERMKTATEKAALYHCYIVLKGNHTLIACPDGEAYFNTSGNSGMATAGSGDVLTGIITGLLAQGYNGKEAGLLGVYIHGRAGDYAADAFSEEAMIAGDITEQLGKAFHTFYINK